MYKTDAGGFAFRCNDIKLMTNASTWATRLSQLARQNGIVRIITYSLPDMPYVRTQLGRRPYDILLIAHSKFVAKARDIKESFARIRVALCEDVHSKVLLIAPKTIYISSANFGASHWHETTIGFHSKDAHDWYVENVFTVLWSESQEVDCTYK